MSEHSEASETSKTGAADPRRAARLMRLATYASVSTAVLLVTAKFAAWIATDSVAMLSALIDSALDVLASLVNLLAVRHALQPADQEHRFGHGKAEALAGLGQAAFITGSAVFLLFQAARRLASPEAIENSELGIAVMVLAIVATLALVTFQRYVVRQTGSVAIAADSLHYGSDLLLNASVIAALILSASFGWRSADPIFAIGIAAVVLFSAWRILRMAFDTLMDREFSDDLRGRIRSIVLSHPEVRDMHDLRTRKSGTNSFIQLHLDLDVDISLLRAHEIADAVEAKIKEAFPEAEVMIHQDPEGIIEDRADFA
ncbi:MAG: cation diffusion facilitator family transporter [Proteobacteria bacterium]|nr:cation diffusion facilitator family transporter [Pseudomonadota bacterium]